jgi:predicted alpha/beta hydrolase
MSSRTGRRIHLALLVVWTVVGIPVSYWLRQSVPWLVFLSVYAIIVGHASGWSAERPTEIEQP